MSYMDKDTDNKTFIQFENVSKEYGTQGRVFYALRDASFTIAQGEMVVILGPSGAGKSTLLNLLGGMDMATSGKIISCGEDISSYNDNQLTAYRAKNVAVVFQFYNLIPTLTAYENVALMRESADNTMEPEKALEAVGLSAHLHQFPATAKNPKLLLCDEPTGALDTDTGRDVLELLVGMSRTEKRTVVMVTHNSSFAEIADKVIRVRNGGIESVVINGHPKAASEVSW